MGAGAGTRSRLRRIQALLLACLAALAFARRDPDYWPLVTWPVYASARPRVPGPTYEALQARAWLGDGSTRSWLQWDLVEFSRARLARRAIEGAAAADAARREAWSPVLIRLVERAVGAEVERVEVWRLEWSVDPKRVPPLDRDAPLSETRLVHVGSAPVAKALP